jgi:hypothetical protein
MCWAAWPRARNYIVISAYSQSGIESGYSNEASVTAT